MERSVLVRVCLLLGVLTLALPPATPARAAGTWAATPDLSTWFAQHTASLLPSGKVLVAGGTGGFADTDAVELYDPAAGTWLVGSPLTGRRTRHTATLLDDGSVLAAGGTSFATNPATILATAERYDPSSGAWLPAHNMSSPRSQHTATRLPDGTVLVVGGVDATFASRATAERYDPATNRWTAAGSMTNSRADHTATLLADGRVLVTGGSTTDPGTHVTTYFASADLYDPATNSWSAATPMAFSRARHTATLLKDGTVLVVGGKSDFSSPTSLELYDPAANSWSAAGTLPDPVDSHTATLLPDGNVLIVGDFDLVDMGYVWISATHELVPAGSFDYFAPADHTATLLPSGKVLIVGGEHSGYSAELYTVDQPPVPSGPLQSLRICTLGTATVPVTVVWGASDVDDDAITAYALQQSTNNGPFANVVLANPAVNIVTRNLTPGDKNRFRAQATDGFGLTGPFSSGPLLTLDAQQENSAAIAYSGAWTQTALNGSFGGAVKFSNKAGAKATFTFSGRSVAWVTTYAPNRGRAEVWLDGVKVAALDLYSAATRLRRVAFARNGLSAGTHHLEIRALGAKSAAATGTRVDVDVMLLLR